MSYILTPPGLETVSVDGVTITGDGTSGNPLVGTALQTVAVDGTTITGDGTVGNPLVAVGGGGASLTDNVSAYRTADSAPLTTPITQTLNTQTDYTADPAFAGTSVTFTGVGIGGINFLVAGTYQVEFNISYETLPAGSKTDLTVDLQMLDAPAFGTVLNRSLATNHLETGDIATGTVQFSKTVVIPAPTVYYFQVDLNSAVPIDVILKGTPSYAWVDVVRLA